MYMSIILHPGKIIEEILISKEGANLSIKKAAEKLVVSFAALSRLINGHASLSVDMAWRLSKLLPSIEMDQWMNLQRDYDIFLAKKRNAKIKLKPLKTVSIEFVEEIFQKYKLKSTPDKKRLMGCYLYNFGKEKEAQAEMVRYQLDHNLELMKQGLLDGIVLHNNSMGGFDLSAYKAAKEWVGEHGNERV